ncbi:NAD(P)-dependent oxidoreductase [Aliifodinibius salipaludis]|uniref:NAD(P)-dependent oxidoreductase n=1 Tax=Fodinibius salipaludis TaxID=2032627 RepID=A0A2A2GDE9_9BACT|nr:SDR family oxidoreductase [Aliifodinibius salipaludis]PAU94802.1 NAD(P)-dependent oxidoreductase [Aliifodinibius salipaludis]
MILVTGANGNLGSQTIDFLLDKNINEDIAGLVRNEEKGAELKEKGVEIRIGDYTDYPSIEEAVQGVNTLLLISSSTLEGRAQQHNNVIEAAKKGGVQQIFYTSIVKAEEELSPLSPDHAKTEKLIKESGIPYTIYRNAFYMEFLPLFLGEAMDTGQWAFPSDGNPINLALRSEMAEALANGLADTEKHANSIYEITSNQAYTLDEIASMLSKASGKEINHTDISASEFEQGLNEAGLPEEQVAMSVMTAQTFVNGGLDFTFDDMEKLLGRKPTGLKTFIKQFVEQ